jgi:hypothetical protein
MMILGIDPGPKQSACLTWDGEQIRGAAITENSQLRLEYTGNIVVAVEHLQCFGMAVGASVFETAYWVGEFRRACKLANLPFVPVTRGEVKMHWCHSMRATDSNIRQALIDRFGAPGVKKSPGLTYGLKKDLWSAFAIAAMTWDKAR